VQTVLLVIDSLHYSGAARQLTLLAAGLPRTAFQVRVAVLGTEAPWVEALRADGVEVDVLRWRRPFDVLPLLALRRLVRSLRPDVLHVWGTMALRMVVLTGSYPLKRLLVSAAVPFTRRRSRLDRGLLRRVAGVIALGDAEAERYRRLGVPQPRLTVVAPAMTLAPHADKPAELPGVAATQRVILCLGPIERHKGFREAVWAFDIVRHLYDDVQFVVAGTGADLPRVRRFARQLALDDHVCFPGSYVDSAPLLQRADVVWVPSLHGGGVCAALEAMTAGRPVVASRCADLAEIVCDGETGLLVEPNNKAALARQTRLLLDQASLRQRLGEAGQLHVRAHFSVERLAENCARCYVDDTIAV
jgi:glycosyltransferase involved in cell wall biosynthesis